MAQSAEIGFWELTNTNSINIGIHTGINIGIYIYL